MAVSALFPPQCALCGEPTASDFGLCALCWRDTRFSAGLVCDKCGLPLPGEDLGRPEHCDDCLTTGRPWKQGRAALLYTGSGRRMVLALKHGDREDLARLSAVWLVRAARPILVEGLLVAPVPLHWRRFFARRYNQSALLSGAVARIAGLEHCPDLLVRRRATPSQEGRSRESRFANLSGAIVAHPHRGRRIAGRPVLLVDDVMTSGATFAAAADACHAAGATSVSVLALARVAKDA